jgi:hypothetical protein
MQCKVWFTRSILGKLAASTYRRIVFVRDEGVRKESGPFVERHLNGLPQFVGSDSFLLQRDGGYRQRNEPRAQQLNPGPAIHLALDRLQPIDLTFHRSVAPFFGDRCVHRENVRPQLAS